MKLLRMLFFFTAGVVLLPALAEAQDTLRISLHEFVKRGLAHSDEIKARRYGIDLAENKVWEARLLGILPRFELTTNHGIVPDVSSDSILANGLPLPKEEYYLDPKLKNDWSSFKLFTQAEIRILQPIYAWGAIRSAVAAARSGAVAASEQFLMEQNKVEMRLYELYYARLLARDLLFLVDDAREKFDIAERTLNEMLEDGDSDIDESEIYKLRIFKEEFLARAEEVRLNLEFLQNTWNLVIGSDDDAILVPEEKELLPVNAMLLNADSYTDAAMVSRPEIRALQAAVDAARNGWKAMEAQRYPAIFLGLGAEYVITPRPVQTKPLFGSRFNYVNLVYSFGIRQNLNFASSAQKSRRAQLTYKQTQYTLDAAVTGVSVDAADKYKSAALAQKKVEASENALQTSKEWLTQEQINYDLGFGEIKNLVEAVKTNLELEVQHLQRIFEFNISYGKLLQASGKPLLNND